MMKQKKIEISSSLQITELHTVTLCRTVDLLIEREIFLECCMANICIQWLKTVYYFFPVH